MIGAVSLPTLRSTGAATEHTCAVGRAGPCSPTSPSTDALDGNWLRGRGLGPGYFITELTRPLPEDARFDAWLGRRTPAARWGDTKELVGAAIFLGSDALSFVNGQVIYFDGAMLATV